MSPLGTIVAPDLLARLSAARATAAAARVEVIEAEAAAKHSEQLVLEGVYNMAGGDPKILGSNEAQRQVTVNAYLRNDGAHAQATTRQLTARTNLVDAEARLEMVLDEYRIARLIVQAAALDGGEP